MPKDKFSIVRELMRNDARKRYHDLLKRRQEETVFAFALVTDEECFGASAVGDTEERAAKRIAAEPPETFLDRMWNEYGIRWNTGEWDEIYTKESPCTDFANSSNRKQHPLETFDGMMKFYQKWLSIEGNTQKKFQQNMLRSMVDALQDLDQEGLFGTGSEREKITLFVEITDSNHEPYVKLKSARVLNPRKSARRLCSSFPLIGRMILPVVYTCLAMKNGRMIAK